MRACNAAPPPPIPASPRALQRATWSGALPVLLSLAPASRSSPTPPRPRHALAARATYLHLALREEVRQLSGHAPTAAGLSRAPRGVSVAEEPPDDGPAGAGGADGGEGEDGADAPSADGAPRPHTGHTTRAAYPECWFEDEESGTPLRWQLFVGVLYDLMKGRALVQRASWQSAAHDPTRDPGLLPWRIRVHFSSYPTARLLPLGEGQDARRRDDDGDRVTDRVRRCFRNSLKQALFLQYASSQVAMSINKRSHERIWEAVVRSDHEAYHEVNARLQAGVKNPPTSTPSSTALAATEDARTDAPHLIPIRLMVDGRPAMQKPIRHEHDTGKERRGIAERLETLGTRQAPPYTTLGEVLADGLPDHFVADPTTGGVTAVSASTVYYCVQGIQPSMTCALVDLWRALSYPDHFLYITVVTQ